MITPAHMPVKFEQEFPNAAVEAGEPARCEHSSKPATASHLLFQFTLLYGKSSS